MVRGRRWVSAAAMAAVVVVTSGCATQTAPPPAPTPPAPTPTTTSVATPTVAPPTGTTPTSTADPAACSQGSCLLEVRARTDVPLSAFGIRQWRITPDPDGVAWQIRPGTAVDQVNGGTGGRDGSTADAAAGAVSPGIGEVFAGGLIMRLVESDGSRALVEFRRGQPTVG